MKYCYYAWKENPTYVSPGMSGIGQLHIFYSKKDRENFLKCNKGIISIKSRDKRVDACLKHNLDYQVYIGNELPYVIRHKF